MCPGTVSTGRLANRSNQLLVYASFVKVEHGLFSLPLIFAGTLLYSRGWFGGRLALLIAVGAIGARVVAMGLNRLIDADMDARNPRTKGRELPRGAMRKTEARSIVVAAGFLYVATAAAIAPVCLLLSPIPVALFAGYPYLKRVTALSHLGLGLAWSMAPLGGWLAASKSLEHFDEVAWLWVFSILWVAGFDIIYALLDEAFDRKEGLKSLPASLGKRQALRVARITHALAFLSLAALWREQLYSPVALWWLIGVGFLFVWQHVIAERDPEKAFFKLNAPIGFMVLAMVMAGMR